MGPKNANIQTAIVTDKVKPLMQRMQIEYEQVTHPTRSLSLSLSLSLSQVSTGIKLDLGPSNSFLSKADRVNPKVAVLMVFWDCL